MSNSDKQEEHDLIDEKDIETAKKLHEEDKPDRWLCSGDSSTTSNPTSNAAEYNGVEPPKTPEPDAWLHSYLAGAMEKETADIEKTMYTDNQDRKPLFSSETIKQVIDQRIKDLAVKKEKVKGQKAVELDLQIHELNKLKEVFSEE